MPLYASDQELFTEAIVERPRLIREQLDTIVFKPDVETGEPTRVSGYSLADLAILRSLSDSDQPGAGA